MRILSYLLFQKNILTQPSRYRLRGLLTLSLLLVSTTGCSEVSLKAGQLPTLLPDLSSEAQFQLRVTPSERPGIYTVAGTTNLPNKSRIAVVAVRYLRSNKPQTQDIKPNLTYSVLAYQDVEVNKGKWQTNLNLWKVAPNGEFKEAWQLEQAKLGIKLEPETGVTFLATVAPNESLADLEQQLQKQGIKLVSNVVRNTVEGERYIQANQILPVALPTGQTTPPPQRPDDLNGGWGPRYLLIPEPPNTNNFEQPNKRRTNAPLSPTELMQ
jgi:hypothetical protein